MNISRLTNKLLIRESPEPHSLTAKEPSMSTLKPATLVLRDRFHTSNPFHDTLAFHGFGPPRTLALDYGRGLPEFVRYESHRNGASATVVFDYVVDLWFAVLNLDSKIESEINRKLDLMTSEDAFERTRTAIEKGDDDVDIQCALIATLAPTEPVESWRRLFSYYLEHEDDFYRHHAVRVLRWMLVGKPAYWPTLWERTAELATSDPVEHVQQAARDSMNWKRGLTADPLLTTLVPADWRVE